MATSRKQQIMKSSNINIYQTSSALLTVLACVSQAAQALDNGLALTPPMGWLAWERYVCETNCAEYPNECIDDNLFLEMGKCLVEDGYRKLGYQYVNIDDCWSTKHRDSVTMELVPDPARFSRSIKYLADEMHKLDLRLGIYGDCGTKTCQGFPGQLMYDKNLTGNYFKLDAQTFAQWGIDSFKFDGCNLEVKNASTICPLMGTELNATGRPMLFSCSWPAYENDENLPTNWDLVAEKCNLWRAFGDIEDSWKSVLETVDWFVKKQDLIVRYHGPGHWFDADQLVIGNFGLSLEQEKAHMAIWCIWASPLYMSNDLRNISKESEKILKNKYAIEINQDRLGIFGMMVEQEGGYLQAFVKPVEPLIDSCPSYAVVYLDRRTLGNWRYATVKISNLIGGIHSKLSETKWAREWAHCSPVHRANATFDAFDVFDDFAQIGEALKLSSDRLRLRVDPSGSRMVKLIGHKR